MLPIVERLTAIRFAALQYQRISPIRHRRRVEAQHGTRLKTSAGEVVARHEHAPIERTELRSAARTALPILLHENKAVEHQLPASSHEVSSGKRHGVRDPRGAGTHTVHWQPER